MTATRIMQLGSLLSAAGLLLLAGCTDGRIQRGQIQITPQQNIGTGGLVFANSFTFNNNALNAVQMKMAGSSLYVTGSPMGFLRAEVAANPEAPAFTFAASDNINVFSPIGQWGFDPYASGAIGITGNLAILSGTFGTSLVSLASTNQPVEVARFPGLTAQGERQSDEAFKYRAVIPNGNKFYGFRQQDYVATVQINNNGLQILRATTYSPSGNVCCVTSGTVFQGMPMVAFGNAVAIFQIGSDGFLTNPSIFAGLQATYITATQNFLYIQHTPTFGNTQTSQFSRGIYVFNSSGQQVAFLPANTFTQFAVSPNDTHLYANRDGQSIEIYRIQR